jgi:hypothetical protein
MASIIGSLFQLSPIARSAKNLVVPDGKTRIGDVVIDATLNEVIDYNSTITQHPIENKSSITDHIFKNPLKIKIEGYITDSPIRLMGLFETPLQNNSLSSLIGNIKNTLPFYSADKPSSQGYFALKRLYETRSLITVVTKYESFPDMAIEALNFNSDEDTGGRLSFSAELIQVIYARVSNNINVNTDNIDLSRITSPKIDMGIVPNASEKAKSWLASGFDSLFN